MNRRLFVRKFITFAGVSLILPAMSSQAFGDERRKPRGGTDLVDPSDSVAKTVGYIHQTKTPGKTCSNCSLYQKKEMRDGKEVGGCPIFAGKVVYGNGFCNSWAKK